MKSSCLFFHSWNSKSEKYWCKIPAHTVNIGGMTIIEEERTDEFYFRVRTCNDCGKRQKQQEFTIIWLNWNHKEGDTLQMRIIGQKEINCNKSK